MALIACTECGHKISSLARFCPKCGHLKGNTEHNAPLSVDHSSLGVDLPEKVTFPAIAFHADTYSSNELLLSEFKPSLDEMIILEGRTFIIKSIFNILDGYAYLTSKRYVLCDPSRVNIVFQIGSNGIVSVEEGRHLISKKIIVTTVSGEAFQVKCQPHFKWFNALLEHKDFADASGKTKSDQQVVSAGTLEWYYETDGVNIGPVKENIIVQLIRNNHTIYRNTKVWNSSLPEWKPAEDTILIIYFGESNTSGTDSTPATKGSSMFSLSVLSYIKQICRKYF